MANRKTYDLLGGQLSAPANANYAARFQQQGATSETQDFWADLPNIGYTRISASAPVGAPPFTGAYHLHTGVSPAQLYFATGGSSGADWQRVSLGGQDIASRTEQTDPTVAGLAILLSNDNKYSLNKLTTGTVGFVIDGGGSAIGTGIQGDLSIDYDATINQVTLLADQTGSIVVDIWKDTYANFPPTVADTITASAKPTITTSDKSQDNTLTGWTTSIISGDILRFNVDSVTDIQRLTIIMDITKTGA